MVTVSFPNCLLSLIKTLLVGCFIKAHSPRNGFASAAVLQLVQKKSRWGLWKLAIFA
tara:strand:- start:657 stop:827 length:171 start_codon:yes stop_codon:yes gene_type:complete